jgi:hypothetical protein
MKNLAKTLIYLSVFSLSISCSNDDNNSNPLEANVFVVGRVDNTITSSYAKIWNNNDATSLTNGNSFAGAQSVLVYNNDIYVAGYAYEEGRSLAKYWKNGIEHNITTSTNNSQAWLSSIFVDNNNIYVCGYETNSSNVKVAKYWLNGVATPLTNGIEEARALDIKVKNGDIYVVGMAKVNNKFRACLWKNGVLTELTDGTYFGSATSVFVDGNNVYVAGFEENDVTTIAKVWINGVENSLSTNESYAECVKFANGKIYVSGWEHFNGKDNATIWINGIANYLTDGSKNAAAQSLFIHNNDIYAAGYEENESGNAGIIKVWKNGEETALTDGTKNAYATGIYVTNQ